MPFASLRTRLILVLAAAIIPFVLYMAVTSAQEKNVAGATLRAEAMARARTTARTLDERMRTINELLDSAMVQINAPGERGLMQLADSRPNPLVRHLSIAVLDTTGRRRLLLLGEAARVDSIPKGRRDTVAAAASGGRSGALFDRVDEGDSRIPNDSIAMIVARPIPKRAQPCGCLGDSTGVIVAVLSDKGLQGLLGTDTLPEGAIAVMLGRSGSPLGRLEKPTRWIDRYGDEPALVSAGVEREGVFALRGKDDVQRAVGFSALERLPWRVYVGLPISAKAERAEHGVRDAVALGALSFAIGMGGIMLVLGTFPSPLRTLTSDIARLATGALTHRSELASQGGDAGDAGLALNAFASELQTEHDEMQEELDRALEVFEFSPVAMWLTDASAASANSGRIRLANAAAARLLGVAAGSLVGQRDDELLDPAAAHLMAPMESGMTAQPVRAGRAQVLTAGGNRRACTVTVTHLTGDATPMRLVTVIEASAAVTAGTPVGAAVAEPSVSAMVVAGRAAPIAAPSPVATAPVVAVIPTVTPEATVTLTAASGSAGSDEPRLVGFAGDVADEFNDLLIGVAGFTQLAMENTHDADMQGLALKRIRELSGHGLTVARQVQSFGGRAMALRGVIDVNEIITEVLQTVGDSLQPEIELDLRLTTSPAVVHADPAMVHDAANALITNAREAMPEGGTLTVATTFVEVPDDRTGQYAAAPGQYIVLTLADNGAGMTPDVQSRMFEPFFTTRSRRGAGLGLAAVAGIARAHGWSISVESEAAVGTAISMYMPLATEERLSAVDDEAITDAALEAALSPAVATAGTQPHEAA